MSSDLALEVSGLGKCFRVFSNPRDRLLQAALGGKRQLFTSVWALENVSFQLERGHTLGVVGRNGSGKSTLLQLICGTLTPTTGHVSVHGRIAALLELGSGFNPEFSGLENIYLNGALLGIKKKMIEQKLDDILGFADIGSYVNQPVKTYSSGMALRLAFSVQAMLDPEILIVDEALAVGDERFQKKCYAHLEKLRENGTSILLVTHSCPTIVQQCDQALLLHRGRARLMSSPKVVTTVYQRMSGGAAADWTEQLEKLATRLQREEAGIETKDERRAEPESDTLTDTQNAQDQEGFDPSYKPTSRVVYPDRGARIEDIQLLSEAGKAINLVPQGKGFGIRLRCYCEETLKDIRINCLITNASGIKITGQVWPGQTPFYDQLKSGEEIDISFGFEARLAPGIYFITAGIKQRHAERYVHRIVDAMMFRVISNGKTRTVGFVDLRSEDVQTKRTFTHSAE